MEILAGLFLVFLWITRIEPNTYPTIEWEGITTQDPSDEDDTLDADDNPN